MKRYIKFEKEGRVNGEIFFQIGKIYEFDNSVGSADRWLARGNVEVTEAEYKAQNKVKDAPAPKPSAPPKDLTDKVNKNIKKQSDQDDEDL